MSDSRRFIADVLSYGWSLPASIAAGAGMGWLLDRFLGTFPIATIAVGFLGLGAGIRQLYVESEKLAAEKDDEDDGRKGPR